MKPSPEIEAIVRRIVAARARGEDITNLNSESEYLFLIGSDEHEWYYGSEVKPMTGTHIEEWGTHQSEILRLHAYEGGSVGWAGVEDRRTYSSGRQSVFRWTMVFELEASTWKVVHSHFSAPVPNLETAGIELTRSLADLVDSIDAQSELSSTANLSGTATLMFTDIVDSTPLSVSLGEKAWVELINNHLNTLKTCVGAEGGTVVKTMGDGSMCAFDSGSSALKAASRIQRTLEDSTAKLQVRIGIHTGDVTQADDDYLGSTVAKAARVAAAAEGGQILVSATTVGLVNAAEFSFGTPVTVELKGLDGTHQLQPLDWS